jgi:hypothetical protein
LFKRVNLYHYVEVLTIAMLLKVIMRRVFTTTQWEALLLLILGITVNQLSACPKQEGGGGGGDGGGAFGAGAGPAEAISTMAIIYTVRAGYKLSIQFTASLKAACFVSSTISTACV